MSIAQKLVRSWFASAVALLFCWITVADGQQPEQAKTPAAPLRQAAATDEAYVLRTYEVGDLVISVQDHPYSNETLRNSPRPVSGGGFGGGGGGGGQFSVPDSAALRTQAHVQGVSGAAPRMMLCQFGGGGGGGGGSLPDETGSAPRPAGPAITMDDLGRVLVGAVASDTWALNGGEGKVEPLGTALVVWQTPAVHQQIERLFDQIRGTSGHRKTLTMDARWLLLTSDELDSLLIQGATDLSEVDRKALAGFTRRGGSIRGIMNCFSGQLVYLVSGTRRNVVSGYIPVVGALENGNRPDSFVASRSRPRIQLVADTSPASPSRESRVGYQPIVENRNLGALLEIRPTLMGGDSGVVVELKSTLTASSEHVAEASRSAATDAIAPAVDRIAIETQEFATTLRVPLGKPILVGGLTYVPGSAKANEPSETSERPQLYLVLEIRSAQ